MSIDVSISLIKLIKDIIGSMEQSFDERVLETFKRYDEGIKGQFQAMRRNVKMKMNVNKMTTPAGPGSILDAEESDLPDYSEKIKDVKDELDEKIIEM